MPFGFHFAVDTLPSRDLQGTGFRSALAVSGFRLRARLGFSIPVSFLWPARHYPRVRIQRSSFERRRDFNPHEQYAAQHTLRASQTPPSRTRPPCGFAPSRTGLPDRQTLWRPPGSRACCFSTCQGLRPRRVPLWLAIFAAADVAFPLSKQGQHTVRQLSGLNRPAHRCLCLRFAVRLAAHHAGLEVGIESLLLFRRALSSPTTCRFIPAHLLSSRACLRFAGCLQSAMNGWGRAMDFHRTATSWLTDCCTRAPAMFGSRGE